jgi:hypothetical protein
VSHGWRRSIGGLGVHSIRFRDYGDVFGNRSLTVAALTRTFDPDTNMIEFAKEPWVRVATVKERLWRRDGEIPDRYERRLQNTLDTVAKICYSLTMDTATKRLCNSLSCTRLSSLSLSSLLW